MLQKGLHKKLVELKEIQTQLQLMLKTIEGVYQDGQIRLTDLPPDVNGISQVLVTFLDSAKINPTKLRQLIEQLETISAIQQGFEAIDAGQTRLLTDFVQEMQQNYDISG